MDEPLLSLRAFIAKVESFGELRDVRGAHWDLELGAIAELSYRARRPRALLFSDITGYPSGRVLTGSTGSARRLGHTLNLGDEHTDATLVDALRGQPSRWSAAARDYPIAVVDDAPLLANEVPGDKVDLLELPGAALARAGRWPVHRHRLPGRDQ